MNQAVASAGEAVAWNALKKTDVDELLRQISYARRRYSEAELDEEMRRIRSLAAQMASDNWKEIEVCQSNPTSSCVDKIKTDYSKVDFSALQDAYRLYPDTSAIISGYERRNNSLVSCKNALPTDCVIVDEGLRVIYAGGYELIGGGAVVPRPTITVRPPVNQAVRGSSASNDANTANPRTPQQQARYDRYARYSPNWATGSFQDSYNRITPNAKPVLSPDGVKTRYTSKDGRYTIIRDNENNYYRIFDNQRRQYLDSHGNVVPTGSRSGKEAQEYIQQQTHIRSID